MTNNQVYVTHGELYRVMYGMEMQQVMQHVTDNSPRKDLLDRVSYTAEIRRALKPEIVLGVYVNNNGYFAVQSKDFSEFDMAKPTQFTMGVFESYVSQAKNSDKVVITDNCGLSGMVAMMAQKLNLRSTIF